MKNILFATSLLVFSVFSTKAQATVSPSSLKIKVYQVAVSVTDDCASPIVIFESADGEERDFSTNPPLGSGNPADGTYQCVMITMSDIVKATPATTEGACIAGTEVSGGVCHNETFTVLNGTTFTTGNCTDGEDKVTLFLHTGTTRVNNGSAFNKPTAVADTANGFQLGTAFVVSGTSAGTFVVDATDKMVEGGGECGLNPPLFSFR